MGIYVNPNNENLKMDMASPIYVDKSMLISSVHISARAVTVVSYSPN